MTPRRQFIRLTALLLFLPQAVYWLGALLNQLAMVLNDGMMPVLWNGINPWQQDESHFVMTHATHLKIICDWINLHSLGIWSPGDVLLSLGDLTIGPAFWMWIAYVVYRAYSNPSLYSMPRPPEPPMQMRGVYGGVGCNSASDVPRVYRA